MAIPIKTARLHLVGQLRETCRQRADMPWLELFHYIIQLFRAYKQKEHQGYCVGKPLCTLRGLYRDLGRSDPASVWTEIDLLLEAFPWQEDGFAEFTTLPDWRQRYPSKKHSVRQRLVELDPSSPQKLRPFKPDGRPLWLVMGGNRLHINGREWQDPCILGEELVHHAEWALWKFLIGMKRLFSTFATEPFQVVGIVPSGIQSRWECRLENFAVSRNPSWTHPRIQVLADDLLSEYGQEMFLADSENILSAYSLGASASEQLMAGIAASLPSVDPDKLCEAIYFGGYVDLHRVPGKRHRTQVVSLMDECVFGSPDLPMDLDVAIQDHWFSSPFTLTSNPWDCIPEGSVESIAETDSGGGWSQIRHTTTTTRLILLAAQTSIPCDATGLAILDRNERMSKTRYGHFLDATLQEFLKTQVASEYLSNLLQRKSNPPRRGSVISSPDNAALTRTRQRRRTA